MNYYDKTLTYKWHYRRKWPLWFLDIGSSVCLFLKSNTFKTICKHDFIHLFFIWTCIACFVSFVDLRICFLLSYYFLFPRQLTRILYIAELEKAWCRGYDDNNICRLRYLFWKLSWVGKFCMRWIMMLFLCGLNFRRCSGPLIFRPCTWRRTVNTC